MKQGTKQYYYRNWELEDYVRVLGDEARTEFMNWITTIKPRRRDRNKAINYNFGISYANDLFKAGEYLVYLYTDEHGIPFYVGKGREDRAINISNRSPAFKDNLTKGDSCRIFAIAYDMREDDALNVETLVINELLDRGWRLSNSQKVAIGQEKLSTLRDNYSGITDVLNKLTYNAIDYLLSDQNPFGDEGKVYVANKTFVKPVAEVSI